MLPLLMYLCNVDVCVLLQLAAGPSMISKSQWMFARKNKVSGWGSRFTSEWKRRWVTLMGRELQMFKEEPTDATVCCRHDCRCVWSARVQSLTCGSYH